MKLWTPPKPKFILAEPRFRAASPYIARKFIDGQHQVGQKLQFGAGDLGPNLIEAIAATVIHTADPISIVAGTNYTLTTIPIGPAAASRRVILGIGSRDNSGTPSVASCTVNGIAAAPITSISAGVNQLTCTMVIADVPLLTDATIQINHSAAIDNLGVGVWAAYDLLSSTPTDFGSSSANPLTDGISVSAGGIIVGYAMNRGGAGALTATWAGVSEDFDELVGGFVTHSGGSDEFASAATPTLTVTPSGGITSQAAVFASFR